MAFQPERTANRIPSDTQVKLLGQHRKLHQRNHVKDGLPGLVGRAASGPLRLSGRPGITHSNVGRVLVLDPDSLTALGAVRCLGSAGWQVGVGSASPAAVARRSKWCRFRHHIPEPQDGLKPFVDAVNGAVDEQDYELVFGCSDAQVFALSSCRKTIHTCVPYSPDHALRRAFDKFELTRMARNVGLGTPATAMTNSLEASRLKPPIVVKSRWHWSVGTSSKERFAVYICQSMDEANIAADALTALGAKTILQEFHDGWLLSFNVVTDQRFRPLIMMQQTAYGIWPLRTGTPASGVTTEVDRTLAEGVSKLLERLRWFGLVNLQFIVPEDGVPRIIDFNGRPYQTIALALGAGVNFMDIWAKLATGRVPVVPERARVGVRYHDFVQDRRRIRDTYGLRPLKLWTCFRFAFGSTHIDWARDDLRPFIYRYYRLVARQVSKHWFGRSIAPS